MHFTLQFFDWSGGEATLMPGYAAFATPWWVPLLYILVLGHLTNICNTLYLHRNQTHGGVELHPVVDRARAAARASVLSLG
jgi:fatty-acid desaturase